MIPRLYLMIGAGVILALALAWVARLENRRAHWNEVAVDRGELLDDITDATKKASGNERVKWDTVAGQIVALGESNRALKGSIEAQNVAIDEMAAEAVRLKAKAVELKAIADKAEAQRAAALRKLSNMAITPGSRNDCLQLLREAEQALDLVRSAG